MLVIFTALTLVECFYLIRGLKKVVIVYISLDVVFYIAGAHSCKFGNVLILICSINGSKIIYIQEWSAQSAI